MNRSACKPIEMQSCVLVKRDVRSALREATAGVHERLHGLPAFTAIAEKRLSLRGYADLLRRIARFHYTVTPALSLEPDRCELLAQDLRTLGAPAASAAPWIAPESPVGRLGSAYVAQGSSLGGKVIYRQLDYLFGESTGGRSFFRGSPSDGPRWRALCRRLEAGCGSRAQLDTTIAGARQTFTLFERIVAPAPA